MNPDAISVARLRFTYALAQKASLPPFLGSAWRGIVGHSLRRASCHQQAEQPIACSPEDPCAYCELFEPVAQRPAPGLEEGLLAPPPMVIEAATHAPSAEELDVVVTLVGTAIRRAGDLVAAMACAEDFGLGARRVPVELVRVASERIVGGEEWLPLRPHSAPGVTRSRWSVPPVPGGEIEVTLLSNLRLKRRGSLLLQPHALQAGDFVSCVVTRWQRLAILYGDRSDQRCYADPAEIARGWQEQWTGLSAEKLDRYSNRQERKVRMDGLRGSFALRGSGGSEAFWPILWQTQYLNVGKGAGMGLGSYRLSTDESQIWVFPAQPQGGRH